MYLKFENRSSSPLFPFQYLPLIIIKVCMNNYPVIYFPPYLFEFKFEKNETETLIECFFRN